MDPRTLLPYVQNALNFAVMLGAVLRYSAQAGTSTSGYVMYVLSAVTCLLIARTLMLIHRLGEDDEKTILWQTATDAAIIVWLFTAYFATGSLSCLTVGLLLLLLLFRPGGRGRRDAIRKIIGEKSRALLSRIAPGHTPHPTET